MALEEISFYNTNGDEINLTNLVNQMVNYYGLKLEVGETKITDFAEGSEIRNLLEAFAVCIYALLEEQHEATKIAFISTSYGGWLDKIGELPFINLPRVQAEYAQGSVTFTLATAQSNDYTIPADTILACSDTGLEFVTTTDCLISTGDTTGTASVECLTTGADGNVSAQSIDTVSPEFVDTELVSVSNGSALENGADEEDDEAYRKRLLENVNADGFGTIGYYNHLCESIRGVHDVLMVSASGYTGKFLVNGYSKPTPDTVLLDVLTALTNTNNKVLGHSFTVDKPTYTTIGTNSNNFIINMNVVSEISETELTKVLTSLFNGTGTGFETEFTGLNINQTLSKEEIINALMVFDGVVEVTNVKVGSDEVTVLEPDSNGVLKLDPTYLVFNQTEV